MRIPNIQADQLDPNELGIINSAMVLMIRTGFKQVTMQHIIQSSDVSKTLMYRYFASKDDVICRILLANEMDLSERFDSWLVTEQVADVFDRYVQFLIKCPQKYRLLQQLETHVDSLEDNALANQWQRLKDRNIARFDIQLQAHNWVTNLPSNECKTMQILLKELALNYNVDAIANESLSFNTVKQRLLNLFNVPIR